MRYLSAPDRRARMLSIVEVQGFSSTVELMAALGVSDMTVRRDAQKLSAEGRVRIVHGGVSVLPASDLQGSGQYEDRASRMAISKRAIGRSAASLVEAGQTLAIDAGTTTLELVRTLPSDMPVSVVTHSASVVAEMLNRSATHLIALGGELHRETLSFDGPHISQIISELQVDVFFLAASGVGPRGVYCANDFDAVTKRALIKIANRVVLLIDSSKFQNSAMVRVCDLNEVDQIIVDDGITDADVSLFRQAEVDVLIALV